MLRIGRVADVHPEDHSVDLVMTDDGSRLAGVQVMSTSASTNTGMNDLVAPSLPQSGDKWDLRQKTDRDLLAVVSFFGQMPIVLGFLFPQVCQMLFADKNRRVVRHSSDVYTSVDDAGNVELYHPSGTYLRIGASGAHEDLTGKDFDGKWRITKNTSSAVHLRMTVANAGLQVASFDVDPSGNIAVTHSGNLSVNTNGTATVTTGGAATVNAPSVTVNAPNSTFTGNVTVEGLFSYMNGIAGHAGSNGSSINGTLNIVSGDVRADSIGLKTHYHSDPQGGNTSTAID